MKKPESQQQLASTSGGVYGGSFAQPHPFAMIFTVLLITCALGILSIPATRLVDPDALADNVALIQWVHLLALVVLVIAAFKMFGTAGRLFKSTMGPSVLVRAAVGLSGIIPAVCGLLFGLLGIVTL